MAKEILSTIGGLIYFIIVCIPVFLVTYILAISISETINLIKKI